MLAGIEKRSADVDMITKNLEKQLDGSPESKVPSKAASTETLKWTRFLFLFLRYTKINTVLSKITEVTPMVMGSETAGLVEQWLIEETREMRANVDWYTVVFECHTGLNEWTAVVIL